MRRGEPCRDQRHPGTERAGASDPRRAVQGLDLPLPSTKGSKIAKDRAPRVSRFGIGILALGRYLVIIWILGPLGEQ